MYYKVNFKTIFNIYLNKLNFNIFFLIDGATKYCLKSNAKNFLTGDTIHVV